MEGELCAMSQNANNWFRNTELLKSASKYGKNLKSISVTGSINAITTGDAEDLKSRELNSDAWNSVSPTHLPLPLSQSFPSVQF
jgi:hypothetical protein